MAEAIIYRKVENLNLVPRIIVSQWIMTRHVNQKKDLRQHKDSDLPVNGVVSLWKNPIPLQEYKTSPVVVYFYSNNRWIPMKCFSLEEAIELYHKASFLGKKIIVYPPYFDPYTQRNTVPPCEQEVH